MAPECLRARAMCTLCGYRARMPEAPEETAAIHLVIAVAYSNYSNRYNEALRRHIYDIGYTIF